MPLNMVPRANLQQRLCRKLEQCLTSFRLPTIQSNNPQVVLDDHWSLPPAPSYKVKVVGWFLPKLRWADVYVVITDHGGSVTAAMSKKINQPQRPLDIEANAMEEGVIFA